MAAKNFAPLRRKLLHWYDRNKRDLPWRHTKDPYAIWLSETMLQQTQVKTVLRYYEMFLRTFPNVEKLDRARLEKVLRAWSGVGYYRRAENLKKAARQIVRDHAGQLPQEFTSLRRLAGVGDYTAGAIMSIAFGQRYPAVDGNVRRVLSRVLAIGNEIEMQTNARQLVSSSRPGDFNQALIELGATLCSPTAPQCARCPLRTECAAMNCPSDKNNSLGRRRIAFKAVHWPLAIVRQNGKVLLRRRAGDGLMARLWELPGGETDGAKQPLNFLRQELRELAPAVRLRKAIGEIRHSITHRRIRAPIYLFDYPANSKLRLPSKRWHWIDVEKIHGQAISSMTAKAIRLLNPHEKSFL
ncbi:MAG: A/G-specific adenine glycosylase [Deltaproteobacteria bacterium]|nr:A/G-specific adenine glycosylase [Deltaproteobacteria bacterium]